MTTYRMNQRLSYLPGGALRVAPGAWGAANEWWIPATGSVTCVGAYQAKGAASLAASYSNLANPGTYDLGLGAAPDFNTSTGWTFVKANSDYLTTGIVPENNQTWSMLIRCTVTNSFFAGVSWAASKGFGIAVNAASRIYAYNGGESNAVITGGTLITLGVAGNKAYRQGTDVGLTIPTSAETNTYPIWIGALNSTNAYYQPGNCDIAAVAIYSNTLTATQVGEITTAMNAL